ncbi:hypothetical protein V6N11_083634 [Hibiscus sabdariffa]|uniref:RNase H type-1 domain-containing protein n=1 Tax=Hibiscus sabdariffa TaxID=183260 RepID=A0ABR2QC67_9ROSI
MGVDWGMKFSIFCWLPWKLRCSMVLDGDYVKRETGFRHIVLETDNKEVASICNGSSSTLARSALVWTIHDLQQRCWQVRVSHVCRVRNGVDDKLDSLGRQHIQQGRIFVVLPGPVAMLVAEEQQLWEEWRAVGASRV